jgi:hypothetical protein
MWTPNITILTLPQLTQHSLFSSSSGHQAASCLYMTLCFTFEVQVARASTAGIKDLAVISVLPSAVLEFCGPGNWFMTTDKVVLCG